ncbi:MAG: trypsin-like peptidase domain-containing protein [Lentisphaeraceae bacterium]|nr:trypsin-like peptidase domain-containing protein [Lentisphaeraceae bacterium]
MREKLFLLAAIVSSSVYFTAFFMSEKTPGIQPKQTPPVSISTEGMLHDEINNINIYNKTAPSVVNVTSIKRTQTLFRSIDEPSGGSGFVWDKKGHIITNFHVVNSVSKIFITLKDDNQQYEAKVIGIAPTKDIAVLKINAPADKLTPINLGSSDNLLVGQKTLALGNPFGLDHTLTTGIISALNRKIDGSGGVEIHGIIQTDASINPGNSGGPLLNSKGEVIGINTAIISNSGSSAGLGFAVPVNTLKEIAPQLIKYGKEIRPSLGVIVDPRIELNRGLAIKVVTHKATRSAGLRGITRDNWGRFYLGDIITEIDSYEINSYNDLYHCLSQYKIGDEVKVTFYRGRKKMETQITLQSN